MKLDRDKLNTALQWALSHDKVLLEMGATMDNLTDIYEYSDFVRVRFDKVGFKKWVRPFHYDGKRYIMKEPKHYKQGTPKPLYMPMPLSDVVYFVEGEKCAKSLADIGICVVTAGGATSIDKCDLTPLQGRKCVIWRDNDEPSEKFQRDLITALERLKIAFEVIDIAGVFLPNGEPLPNDGGDCYDFIQAHFADGNDDKGICELIHNLPRLETEPLADDPKALLKQTKASLQAVISELAELDEMELHLSIKAVSSQFGISQKVLLGFVSERQQGELVKDTTPHSEPIDGKELYKELYALIDDFMVIDEPYKVAFVLWVIFSYIVDIAEIAPIAWITSPEKQCGKSTLFGLFSKVVYRPFTANNITQAVLYRVMEKYKPCLMIDEIDTSLKDKYELLGIVNAGYSKHACYTPRVNSDKGNSIEAFNAFGAKVFCGIGEMIGTFASRSIRFELRRKSKDDKTVKRLNHKTLPHAQTELLKSKIKRWSDDNRHTIQAVDIPLIDINDRDFDNWYILLQIAKVLGVYDVALKSCLTICQKDKEMSQNEQLLSDIRECWNGEKMGSTLLLERLTANSENVWQTYNNGQPMTAHQLARHLKFFGIKSKDIRQGQSVIKGYDRSDFVEVWQRYLPPQTEPQNPFLLPQ